MTREPDHAERAAFDEIANAYDLHRPTYPHQLFSDLVALTGIDDRSRALEVGTGPGKATRGLARRGISILGLEPGQKLAAVARTNLQSFSQVEIITTSFESWPPEREAFALVYSAQAFHWVAPEVRFVKAWEALRKGGWLAIFANVPRRGESELDRAIDACYQECAPSHRATGMERRDVMESQFLSCPLFQTLPVRRYDWSTAYSAEKYVALLGTYSDHQTLPEAERVALFGGISAAIKAHGGTLELGYETKLLLGMRLG
ncbi:MAG TPA: class I SAM-dependent methyltransferase [Solirubrobacterales bacterium]|nr:class I SAM-dependent methyltransferase [Solirubrobacterales bacterium]